MRNLPIGPVPCAQEPFPPSSNTVYYAFREGIILVRADITYLRQDFSLQQKVDNPGDWPEMQRFDFLVRTREVSEREYKGQSIRKESGYKDAIVYALRSLTGNDEPANAPAWRKVLQTSSAKGR